jgi:hypothetical protein
MIFKGELEAYIKRKAMLDEGILIGNRTVHRFTTKQTEAASSMGDNQSGTRRYIVD